MMITTFLLLIIPLINLTISQIPNPIRYQVTFNDASHYAVDKIRYRLSSKICSINESLSTGCSSQEIYVPSEGRTYTFRLNSANPCIANRGAFLKYIDTWPDIVESYGGENKTYDKIIFDKDCDGPCLTWFTQFNETQYTFMNYQNRLYVRQSDSRPIKTTQARYDLKTGELVGETEIQRGDIDKALNIFSTIDKKSIYLYTVIFKGLITNNKSDKVLDLYDKMTIKPNNFTLTVIFSACAQLANQRAMIIGKKLLKQTLKTDSTDNIMLTSAINMLMAFGFVKDAETLFQLIKNKHTIVYGTMMKGYNNNNQPLKSLQLFQQMKNENVKLDEIKFLLLINSCSQIGILSICQHIVNQIPPHFFNNIQIGASLIDMWETGSIKNAQQIFQSIKNPDVVTYNAMINSFGLNLMGLEAVKLYETIPNNIRDEISHICVLNACSHSGLLHQAYQIFNQISNKTEKIVATMIDGLSRLFLFDEAQKLLDEYEKTNSPSVVMYTAILSGARNHRNSTLSEKIYDKMKVLFPDQKDDMVSSSILLSNIYNSLGDSQRAQDIRSNRINKFGKKVKPGLAWTEINDEIVEFRAHDQSHPRSKEIYEEAKKISSELIAYGYEYDSTWITRPLGEDETVESVLCGHSERLAIAFNFVVRSNPSMIQITKNLRVCGDCHEATKLIAKIRKCEIIVRDANSCIKLKDYQRIEAIEKKLSKESLNNSYVQTSLIQFYIGSIKNAQQTFELIKNRDLISYNTMIKSYRLNLMGLRAIELYETMPVAPDDVTYSAIMDTCTQLNNDQAKTIGKKIIDQILKKRSTNNIMLTSAINMLMNFGEVKDAEQIFEKIKEKDSIAYGTMMKGYNINNQPLKTLQLFQQMKKENIKPDEIIFVLLINTYAQIGILSLCHKIVTEIPSHFSNNIQISNSLIDMWGKVSSVKNAQEIFESIKNPDVITYNTMINSFGLNLMGLEAVKLYETIPNNIRDEISHICVLNACSHSGLLHQAYQIFNQISNKTEKITTTMIDGLSRLFLFDEAQKLLDEYEKTNSASLIMYMTILSGARNHRNSSLSEKLYDKIKILFPNEKDHIISGSILLCNVYTSLGDSQRAQDIRSNRINKFGKKVKPGLAWTEFNGEIVEFRAHDQSHPRSKEIYEEAKKISSELIAYGYEYDSTWITRPLGEDETVESVLCGHSERLAIAFNFVVRSNPSMIQITKNLRVCGDCHEATKLIAKIRKCEIIVRDANCIHHFHTNGQCSCQDHF
ncbi:hypothetical protein I4U23_021785 [Adineta vaga]|nr:hypothetical protein I4U23_021785 [Adineta vaga]